jgi:hypothetical protein
MKVKVHDDSISKEGFKPAAPLFFSVNVFDLGISGTVPMTKKGIKTSTTRMNRARISRRKRVPEKQGTFAKPE